MLEARWAKIMMTAGIALFALLAAFDNVTDYGSNFEFVRHVLSMDTTFPGNALMYRAVTAPILWHAAYIMIIAAEAATALLLGLGSIAMVRARLAPSARFHAAKRLVFAGVTLGFALWFVGFEIVAGEWFAMWQSKEWNGQEAAYRFYMTLLAVLIVVGPPDAELPAVTERAA